MDFDPQRFEALSALWHQAWDSFNERRRYEWRASIGVWTILAITTAGIVSRRVQADQPTLFLLGVGVAGLLIVVLHAAWLKGLGRANYLDRRIAHHYERRMQYMIGAEFDNDLKTLLAGTTVSRGRYFWGNWNHMSQIGISVVLYLAALTAAVSFAG